MITKHRPVCHAVFQDVRHFTQNRLQGRKLEFFRNLGIQRQENLLDCGVLTLINAYVKQLAYN